MADSNIGATVVDAIRAALPDTNAQIRHAGDDEDALAGTVTGCVCTGIEMFRDMTEQGAGTSKEGNVRYKLADEPAAWSVKDAGDNVTPGAGRSEPAIMGAKVDVLLPGYTDWDDAVTCRVNNRIAMAGAVRLSVVALYEES